MAETPGGVPVLGPRQCGKSTLAEHQVSERAYYSLDEDNDLTAARLNP